MRVRMGMTMIMSMLVVMMRMIDVVCLNPIYQHVNFRGRNPAAINTADAKLSSDL
jgi:hypothetical protein